ncbi:tRNA1(Val) (adenine(37)-N6)-methyltransferase [Sneathiella chinensis]|uniref:Methyltransferase n=1 Tax=Sneathiella chinensis TaxID=349750 RepID=A0ABQ5U417_9PROT|nr:methyltransferase [Sneathiella chinensis]GLQ06410.1 methyltransferase [Sneathiella chinensis]
MTGWTTDGFLGGRLQITQPEKGFRAGSDAVLLAASLDLAPGQSVLDVGCGVGTAGLCARYREPGIRLWGLELQESLAVQARENARANGLERDVTILSVDIADRKAFKGIEGPSGRAFLNDGFDHVLSNPPFYEEGRAQKSPNAIKSLAHVEGDVDLSAWIAFCAARARPRGRVTIIHRASRLATILREMEKTCGSLQVLPLWPGVGAAAKRVIVRGIKGDRGPLTLLPGLVLHHPDGRPTDEAEKILRHGAGIDPAAH